MKSISIVLAALALFLPLQSSQAIEPALGDIVDTRSSGGMIGNLRVELKVAGDEVPDVEAMRASVISILDETGRDLNDLAKQESQSQRFSTFWPGHGIQLTFKNPSRKAGTLKELIGRLDLFIPRNDPESVLVVDNAPSRFDQVIESPAFKTSSFSLIMMNRQQYEARTKRESEATGKSGGSFANLLGGFGPMGVGDAKSVYVQVKDPEGRFSGIEFLSADGQRIKSQSTLSTANTYTLLYSAALPADAKARIKVATPKSVVRVPFQFENVVLP